MLAAAACMRVEVDDAAAGRFELGCALGIPVLQVYEPFFADFGPLNLGKTYRFCQKVNAYLAEGERVKRRVFYCCGPHVHNRANAAVLVRGDRRLRFSYAWVYSAAR